MNSPQLHDLEIEDLVAHTTHIFKTIAAWGREAEAAKKAAVGQAELAEATVMVEQRRKQYALAEKARMAAYKANASQNNANIYAAEREKAIKYLNSLHQEQLIGDWSDELANAGKIIKRRIRKNIKKTKRRRQKLAKRRRGATTRR